MNMSTLVAIIVRFSPWRLSATEYSKQASIGKYTGGEGWLLWWGDTEIEADWHFAFCWSVCFISFGWGEKCIINIDLLAAIWSATNLISSIYVMEGYNDLIDMIAFLWHELCTMDPQAFNVNALFWSDKILHVLWHRLWLYGFISLNINISVTFYYEHNSRTSSINPVEFPCPKWNDPQIKLSSQST